jgi:hypothetical protein
MKGLSRQVETLVRQLPSDEEIEKAALASNGMTQRDNEDRIASAYIKGFNEGAEWMRNQARQSA